MGAVGGVVPTAYRQGTVNCSPLSTNGAYASQGACPGRPPPQPHSRLHLYVLMQGAARMAGTARLPRHASPLLAHTPDDMSSRAGCKCVLAQPTAAARKHLAAPKKK
jgi:hypothetical protein